MNKIFDKLKNQQNKKNIVVVGDSILDKYIYGELNEKKLTIFKSAKQNYNIGGAANVAHNIMKMGCNYMFLSIIGDGEKSELFQRLINDKGFDSTYIIKDNYRDICLKTRLISNDNVIIRIDEDFVDEVSSTASDHLYNQLKYNIDNIHVLILSNYYKGCITEDLFLKIKNLCIKNNVKLLLDCSKKHDFSGVFLLKPSLAEFENITGCHYKNMNDIIYGGTTFKKDNNIQHLLISMDKDGLIYIDENNRYHHMQSLCRNVIDPCGAGDSLLAGIAVCLANHIDIKDSVEFGNNVAAVCCSNMGTYAVSFEEVINSWNNVRG